MDIFKDITRDVVSDLYQYMTPSELYLRRGLNPYWDRQLEEVLPEWSSSIEPWTLAAKFGDLEFLRKLLKYNPIPIPIDEDFNKEHMARELVEIALDNYHPEAARFILENIKQEHLEKILYFSDPRILRLDDRYALHTLNTAHKIDLADAYWLFVNSYDKLFEDFYRRGLLSEEWLIDFMRELIEDRRVSSLFLAGNLSSLLDSLGITLPANISEELDSQYNRAENAI